MIMVMATAALLSCSEAQQIVSSIDTTKLTSTEVREVITSVTAAAPRQCSLRHPNETT